MIKTLTLSDDCIVKLDVRPSGIDKMVTLEISTYIPQAINPRWQLNKQITLDRCQLWDIGTYIHQACHSPEIASGSTIAA